MKSYNQFELWFGRNETPPKSCTVHAGPIKAQLTERDLRYVRVEGAEILRRIYVAVRDHNWLTIPGKISEFKLEADDTGFQACFSVRHLHEAVDFTWRGQIVGTADGVLTYSMAGRAGSTFPYNRIGFCVLHPVGTAAGQTYRAQTQGGPVRGTLPSLVGVQRFEDGVFIPLFPSFNQLVMNLRGGSVARLDFEGDWFEMEDQRNWTDNSFKTYCTPLALSFPKTAQAGQEFSQKVTLVLEKKPKWKKRLSQELTLKVGKSLGQRLPRLGLGMNDKGEPLSARETGLFQRLRLDHLRADLHLNNARAAENRLHQAAATCQQVGCGLEVALFLTRNAVDQLEDLCDWIEAGTPITRFLVFHEEEPCTAPKWVRLARKRLQSLAPSAEFVGGTNAYFAELNRTRPDTAAMDGVVYSLNPQVHAQDETSMAENLEPQAMTVQTARSFAGEGRIIVSPVTLKPRYNANATGPEPGARRGELPASVDTRQMSLFAAGWTVGSLKYLAESGADAVTYYEMTGWRGVMEREGGSPLPRRFRTSPGQLFPVYHVLADVAHWKGCLVTKCESNQPLRVVGLALRNANARHLLVANLTAEPQTARLIGLDDHKLTVRVLDVSNAWAAMRDPAFFTQAKPWKPLRRGTPTLELGPYAIGLMDASTR